MMHVVIISSSSSKAKKKNQDISLCAASCVLQSLFWNNPDYDQQQSKRERQREMKGGIKLQITAAHPIPAHRMTEHLIHNYLVSAYSAIILTYY